MRELIIVVAVLGVSAFGYYMMGKLDGFLGENRKAIEKETEVREPSCILFTEDLSVEEIAEEIRQFRKNHDKTRIIMYDSSDTEWVKYIEQTRSNEHG